MAVTLVTEELLFVVGETGDEIATEQVVLDSDKPPFGIRMQWMPAVELWLCTVTTIEVVPIVSGAAMYHREDVLSNIVVPDRPAGAIVPETPDGGALHRDSWSTGARLHYIPGGLGPLLDAAVAGL